MFVPILIYGGIAMVGALAGVAHRLGPQAVVERLNADQRARMQALTDEIENLRNEQELIMIRNANQEDYLIGQIANREREIELKKKDLEYYQLCTNVAVEMLKAAEIMQKLTMTQTNQN